MSQYPIGSYRIDIAILDDITSSFLLGIEVDGFKYYSIARQKYNDELRQSFIEAKGYKILEFQRCIKNQIKKKFLIK